MNFAFEPRSSQKTLFAGTPALMTRFRMISSSSGGVRRRAQTLLLMPTKSPGETSDFHASAARDLRRTLATARSSIRPSTSGLSLPAASSTPSSRIRTTRDSFGVPVCAAAGNPTAADSAAEATPRMKSRRVITGRSLLILETSVLVVTFDAVTAAGLT